MGYGLWVNFIQPAEPHRVLLRLLQRLLQLLVRLDELLLLLAARRDVLLQKLSLRLDFAKHLRELLVPVLFLRDVGGKTFF
jgi:hypothetical protein